MRLLGVELTRLRWRRAVLLLVLIAVVVPVLVLVSRALQTAPPSEAEIAEARSQVRQEQQFYDRQVERCEQRDGKRCEQRFYQPRLGDFLFSEQLRLAEEREGGGLAVVAAVAALMFLAGTTFAGHDWASGSMSNQLLFEPRRLRVWVAKALAITLLSAVMAVVALVVFWGGLYLLVRSRDIDPSGQVLTSVAQTAGRGALLIVAGGLGGYLLTMLSRSTVFTIGVLFAVSVAGGLLFAALPSAALHYEPTTNALGLVLGRFEYYVDPPSSCFTERGATISTGPGTECSGMAEVDQVDGAIYYGVLLLVVGAASAVSYRRRDVP